MLVRSDFIISAKDQKSFRKTYLLERTDKLSFQITNSDIPIKSIEFTTQFDAENFLNQLIIFYLRKD